MGENLKLIDSSITHLYGKLSVKGSFTCKDCRNLTSLPEQMDIGDALDLWFLDNLVSLPEKIGTGRDFIIINCPRLTSLPKRISIG